MRKWLSVLLIASMLVMLIPAVAFAAAPKVTVGECVYNDKTVTATSSTDGNTVTVNIDPKDLPNGATVYVSLSISSGGGSEQYLITPGYAYIKNGSYYVAVSKGQSRTYTVKEAGVPEETTTVQINCTSSSSNQPSGPEVGPGWVGDPGWVGGSTWVGQPSKPSYPGEYMYPGTWETAPSWGNNYYDNYYHHYYYDPYYPYYVGPGNAEYVNDPWQWYWDTTHSVTVNGQTIKPSNSYLEVMSVIAAGSQFGNASVSNVNRTLRVDVAAYTSADRAAIGAAGDDYVRIRVRPISPYGYMYAPGTTVSAVSPATTSLLAGTSKNAYGSYVLDSEGCFYLNISGLKRAAGFTGSNIPAQLSSVSVLVNGNTTISVPVSYRTVSRNVTLVGAPETVSVAAGSTAPIFAYSSNGGSILPLIRWSVVQKLSDGQVSVNGYSVTGLKTGTVVLVGTSGNKTVTVTVEVTKGSTIPSAPTVTTQTPTVTVTSPATTTTTNKGTTTTNRRPVTRG